MSIFPDIFTEMAVLLLLAAGVGAVGVRLRQPLIVAFLAVGILVGPSVLGWVSANDRIDLLAKLGISLLLFVVGLKLDMHIIRTMGPLACIQWVVSTVHERNVNQSLIHSLRNQGYAGRIAVTAHGPGEVARLQLAGADLVLMPFEDAASEAADRLLGEVSL